MTQSRTVRRVAAWAGLMLVAGLIGAALTPSNGGTQAFAAPAAEAGPAKGFLKIGGIDGEATDENHDKWIDVLSIDWGSHKPGGGATGQSRRRGAVIVEDMTLTVRLDKASPKLMEKCLNGEVIPTLVVDASKDSAVGPRTALRFELTNVRITGFRVVPPTDTLGRAIEGARNNIQLGTFFEQVRVIYTERDREGSPLGDTEFGWDVKKRKPM